MDNSQGQISVVARSDMCCFCCCCLACAGYCCLKCAIRHFRKEKGSGKPVIVFGIFTRDAPVSLRLEVVGTRKKRRAKRRHACLPRARPFSFSPTTSKHLLRRLRASQHWSIFFLDLSNSPTSLCES